MTFLLLAQSLCLSIILFTSDVYLSPVNSEAHVSKKIAPQHLDAMKDSVVQTSISAGVVHTSYVLNGPFTVDVVTVDLKAPHIAIDTFRPDSLTRTTEQVRMAGARGDSVIAAINADFFSFRTHWPVGNQVADGVPITGLQTLRSHMSISSEGRMTFGQAQFTSSVGFEDGSVRSIEGLNTHDSTATVKLFNSYWGTSTGTADSVTDVLLEHLQGGWKLGDTTMFRVAGIDKDGNAPIERDGAVLSFLDMSPRLNVSDTLRIALCYGDHGSDIRMLIGGAGRILVQGDMPPDGNRKQEKIGARFITDRHPRTFLAIDRDTSTFYMCTVDGRQESSLGMNFQEMADFLKNIGAWNAINLDGGGSTTMVIAGRIVNSPSDRSGERPVANTVMVLQQ